MNKNVTELHVCIEFMTYYYMALGETFDMEYCIGRYMQNHLATSQGNQLNIICRFHNTKKEISYPYVLPGGLFIQNMSSLVMAFSIAPGICDTKFQIEI